ncbi:transposon Tf2-8 polyprotein [Trichonephila clavipes]|uniref:Transposon Tf2-8 polyprotein n=1 Tax=Trichonephila clavipes TaxID=2585209 RepID=A0A8X6RNE2_TRICX|nr:transposon Tf2-8 polyprotein [Trichonephila clavipes]
MQHVDALSRYPVTIITSDTLTARLQRAQQEDENIQNLKSLIGTNNATDFFIKNEILYKYVDGRELIAAPRDMQTELIKLAHEKGHFSSAKTEEIFITFIIVGGFSFNSYKGPNRAADLYRRENPKFVYHHRRTLSGTVKWKNPPNSNPRFDQVVNRRSKMVQIRRPTSKNSK